MEEGRVRIAVAAVLCMLALAPSAGATGCDATMSFCSVDVAAGPVAASCQEGTLDPTSPTRTTVSGCTASATDGAQASCGDTDTQTGANEDGIVACGASAGPASARCTSEQTGDGAGDVTNERACTTSAAGATAACADDQLHFADVTQRTIDCAAGDAVACDSAGTTDPSGSARTTACSTPAGDESVPTSPDPLTDGTLPPA